MPRRLAFDSLGLVDEGTATARDALASLRARRPLADRDYGLASEIAQGVLRRELTLDAILALRLRLPIRRLDSRVHRVLRIGTYQILFLDRVPHAAAVTTSVDLARDVGRSGAAGLVNAVLRGVAGLVTATEDAVTCAGDAVPRRTLPRGDGTSVRLAEDAFPDPHADLAAHLAVRYGVPAWAVARFVAQHGPEGARQILEASIVRPSLAVRPRAGRIDEVAAAFGTAGLDFDREGPCLVVRGAGDVRALPLWDAQAWSVQDATAAEVAAAVAPEPGSAVLDLCAAPGGKSFALAEIVGPSGRVVAVDLPGPRASLLADEVRRRGVANLFVVAADATDASALPAGRGRNTNASDASAFDADGFDVVLLDAPCSNSGVLARRVEARRRLGGPEALASLAALQTKLLAAAATRVRPGGRLAWSTCSVDDDENGARVRAFLASHAGFALVSERLTLPVAARRDGGYVAVLERAGRSPGSGDRA